MKMDEIEKVYESMKCYKFSHKIVLEKFGPDIGSVIMDCLNDLFVSHLSISNSRK